MVEKFGFVMEQRQRARELYRNHNFSRCFGKYTATIECMSIKIDGGDYCNHGLIYDHVIHPFKQGLKDNVFAMDYGIPRKDIRNWIYKTIMERY